MNSLKTTLFFGLLFSIFSCKTADGIATRTERPKNVILLISDGTGLSQISSAFYFQDKTSNYTRFENIGLINTSSSQEDITDSAAGATAFASGIKTYNGSIGLSDDYKDAKTIVEIASENNVKTGLITTSSLTHATPASFFAHVKNRGMENEIAAYLPKSGVDFFAGGGLRFFSGRNDNLDLIAALRAEKFTIDTTSLGNYNSIKSDEKLGFILADNALPKMQEGRGNFLAKAIEAGTDFLSKNRSPFFMMAEGSQIDWGGHNNDAPYLIAELIDFDEAIGKALDFAEKDGNTLVIVTSDHETGGFTLAAKKNKRDDGSEYSDYREIGPTFSTGGHSATLIPVFAFGPGSENFKGIYQNNEIFHKIINLTNWKIKQK
ncbi:alkaline phosphatase [Leeuwenhoekiella aequorea]|uniref:Alkaline phosphatase n=1 Tax=Leeuwenhoekiella aequorea TaxID=283736 RepID=A0A4Q0P6E3_9FLAO|nr:alkaline phosphatase [Leeuwenhoekiella aequorea]RXG21229.1 alkaline phosphatase [Leeuwenhoekiella aequorea]